jgi:lycopene cyclase domain-containing protein
MEYFYASAIGLLVALSLAFSQRLFSKKFFAAMLAAIIFELVFDNLAVSQGIWNFPAAARTGLRLGFIPVENVLFGAALFCLSATAWEFSGRRGRNDADARQNA